MRAVLETEKGQKQVSGWELPQGRAAMTEAEVRALRNRVFDHVISDSAWSAVRKAWMSPSEQAWLKAHDFPLVTQHSDEYRQEHENLS